MRYIPYQQPMGGQQSSYMNPPTIGSVGAYGYNGYNMYNPYYIRQREEAQRRYNDWNRNNQMDIWAKLNGCVSNCLGTEPVPMEQMMHQMQDNYQAYMQNAQDFKMVSDCSSIIERSIARTNQESAMVVQIEQKRKEYEEKQKAESDNEPDGNALFEWLRNEGSERYREALNDSVRRNQRNTAQLYDSNGYHQLLQAHTSFNALKPNVTIDDMEIQVNLPMRLAQEREARRRAFIAKITEGMG